MGVHVTQLRPRARRAGPTWPDGSGELSPGSGIFMRGADRRARRARTVETPRAMGICAPAPRPRRSGGRARRRSATSMEAAEWTPTARGLPRRARRRASCVNPAGGGLDALDGARAQQDWGAIQLPGRVTTPTRSPRRCSSRSPSRPRSSRGTATRCAVIRGRGRPRRGARPGYGVSGRRRRSIPGPAERPARRSSQSCADERRDGRALVTGASVAASAGQRRRCSPSGGAAVACLDVNAEGARRDASTRSRRRGGLWPLHGRRHRRSTAVEAARVAAAVARAGRAATPSPTSPASATSPATSPRSRRTSGRACSRST